MQKKKLKSAKKLKREVGESHGVKADPFDDFSSSEPSDLSVHSASAVSSWLGIPAPLNRVSGRWAQPAAGGAWVALWKYRHLNLARGSGGAVWEVVQGSWRIAQEVELGWRSTPPIALCKSPLPLIKKISVSPIKNKSETTKAKKDTLESLGDFCDIYF